MSKLSDVGRLDRAIVSALVGFALALTFAAIALYGLTHRRDWQDFTALPILPGVKVADALDSVGAGPSQVGVVITANAVVYALGVFAIWEWIWRKQKL